MRDSDVRKEIERMEDIRQEEQDRFIKRVNGDLKNVLIEKGWDKPRRNNMIESLNDFTTEDLKNLLEVYQESPSLGIRDEIIMSNIERILEERANQNR
jgi:hypothetical protein